LPGDVARGTSPEISVLTVTRERRELLLQKQASLARQTLAADRFEWVVIVNGPDDGSGEALRRSAAPFRRILIEGGGPAPIGAARNRAAAAASAPLLHLSDDDCLLPPETLASHLALQSSPAVVLGGIVFEADGADESFQPRRARFWQLNGANTTLPARAFAEVGGFDASIVGYGGEDLLLGYRLQRAGWPLRAAPEVAVRHLGPNPLRGRDRAKARSAGRNAVRIARLHPELAYRLGVHPLQLGFKRLLSLLPDRGRLRYERAYLAGARSERDRAGAVASTEAPPRDPDRTR
jgi:GT2 family glycosyltransferase